MGRDSGSVQWFTAQYIPRWRSRKAGLAGLQCPKFRLLAGVQRYGYSSSLLYDHTYRYPEKRYMTFAFGATETENIR